MIILHIENPRKETNDGQSLLGCLLSLDQEPGRVSGLREACGTGDPGCGRQVSRARQSGEGVRIRDESARGRDRVRQRAAGASLSRRRWLPGGAESPGRRGQARYAERRGRGLKPPRRLRRHPSSREEGKTTPALRATPPQGRRGKRGGTSSRR